MKFKLNKKAAIKKNYITLSKALSIILGLSIVLVLFSSHLETSSLIFIYSCLSLWLISELYRFATYFSLVENLVLEITDHELIVRRSKTSIPGVIKKRDMRLGDVIRRDGVPISISTVVYGVTVTYEDYDEMEKLIEKIKELTDQSPQNRKHKKSKTSRDRSGSGSLISTRCR